MTSPEVERAAFIVQPERNAIQIKQFFSDADDNIIEIDFGENEKTRCLATPGYDHFQIGLTRRYKRKYFPSKLSAGRLADR